MKMNMKKKKKVGMIVVGIQDTEMVRTAHSIKALMITVETSITVMIHTIMDSLMGACRWKAILEMCVSLQLMHEMSRKLIICRTVGEELFRL